MISVVSYLNWLIVLAGAWFGWQLLRQNGRILVGQAAIGNVETTATASTLPALRKLTTRSAAMDFLPRTGVARSKVIAVGNPIEVHGGGGIVLPRAAAPFDISMERIHERRRALKCQIP